MSLHDERYRQVIERLVAARRRAGLSQLAVANRLVLDPKQPAKRPPQSFVSKCETRERRLDAVELADFARVYGISVGDLLGEGELLAGASLAREGGAATGASVTDEAGPRSAPRASPSRARTHAAKRGPKRRGPPGRRR